MVAVLIWIHNFKFMQCDKLLILLYVNVMGSVQAAKDLCVFNQRVSQCLVRGMLL